MIGDALHNILDNEQAASTHWWRTCRDALAYYNKSDNAFTYARATIDGSEA